jgi:hypothetical protein
MDGGCGLVVLSALIEAKQGKSGKSDTMVTGDVSPLTT